MASPKTSVHLTNEKGAIICQSKTARHKAALEAWQKLDPKEQCGNCRLVLARKMRKGRSFGSVFFARKKPVTEDPLASYTPRHGQV